MTDTHKKVGLAILALVAVGFAVFSALNASSGTKEQVVGTLPMAEGGGRDSEKAAGEKPAVADEASGMPADMIQGK